MMNLMKLRKTSFVDSRQWQKKNAHKNTSFFNVSCIIVINVNKEQWKLQPW